MDDYISREAAMSMPWANGQYDHEHANEHFICGLETYKEWLEQIPAADVRPVVHAEWEQVPGKYDKLFRCSKCHFVPIEPHYFCQNCGADMRPRVGFQVGSDLEPEHNVTELNLTEQSATEQGGRG